MGGDGRSARRISLSGACGGLFGACGGLFPPGPRALKRAEKKMLRLTTSLAPVHFPLAVLLLFVVCFLPHKKGGSARSGACGGHQRMNRASRFFCSDKATSQTRRAQELRRSSS